MRGHTILCCRQAVLQLLLLVGLLVVLLLLGLLLWLISGQRQLRAPPLAWGLLNRLCTTLVGLQ